MPLKLPFKHYITTLSPPSGEAAPLGIDYFREQLLFYLLAVLAGFGSIAYLPSIYYGIKYQFYSVVFIDTLALGWVFFLLAKKNLAFLKKSLGLLMVFYILGVWLLVSLGPTGAGFMWMLLFSIMTGVLLGFRPALISFGLNFITIAILSLLVAKQTITWDLIQADAMAIWTVKGVNFICINAIVAISTGFLITKISWMAREEQQRRRELAREMKARLKAEEETKELTARLYQSQKMEAMGTLAGGVAHDFNNILSTIMGYTELTLMTKNLPAPVENNLAHIIQAAERAKGISHQILTFSRHTPAKKSPNDLGLIAGECFDFFKISVPPGVGLNRRIPDRPLPILGDKNQIYQVIMNLLFNSLHALESIPDQKQALKRKKITLSITRAKGEALSGSEVSEQDHLVLAVTDTGEGIPQEMVSRVFEPYFTTKENGKGTGMGLSISHGIVKEHKGEILVNSIPDKGTTFTVLLPLHTAPAPRPVPLADPASGGREHILMVDDESNLLFVHSKILTALGYRVTTSDNPGQALDLIQRAPENFDLVITDRKMPEMTGAELCRKITATCPDLPIMLCTGFPRDTDRELFHRVLVKPVGAKELTTSVRRVLDSRDPGLIPKG